MGYDRNERRQVTGGQPGWFRFLRRSFPSGNSVLVTGVRPVLIDTGFGSDAAETLRLIESQGVPPGSLTNILNTHHHSDHVGGNGAFSRITDAPISAHPIEARSINRGDAVACRAEWLDQPVEAYRVNEFLDEGDVIDLGGGELQVLHAPGHTAGQICFYEPTERVLICGDVLLGSDVGWINLVNEGTSPVEEAISSLERLMRLDARVAYPGHGAPIPDVAEACRRTIRRYERWIDDPEAVAWHGCRRIFAFALMINNGIPADDVYGYIEGTQWARDHARMVLGIPVAQLARELVDGLIETRSVFWSNGRLLSRVPHKVPRPGWASGPTRPGAWPPLIATEPTGPDRTELPPGYRMGRRPRSP